MLLQARNSDCTKGITADRVACCLQHGCPLEMRGAHLTVPAQVGPSTILAKDVVGKVWDAGVAWGVQVPCLSRGTQADGRPLQPTGICCPRSAATLRCECYRQLEGSLP